MRGVSVPVPGWWVIDWLCRCRLCGACFGVRQGKRFSFCGNGLPCSVCVQWQGGDAVYPLELRVEDFCSWLCRHEWDDVGQPGRCFQSPLALWLSEMTGHVYGVDGLRYGRALWDGCCWLELPRWAQVFAARLEQVSTSVVMGYQAFAILAHVETALSRLQRVPSVRRSSEAA